MFLTIFDNGNYLTKINQTFFKNNRVVNLTPKKEYLFYYINF